MIRNFNYDLVRYVIPNYKLHTDTKVVLIADLHGYTNNKLRSDALANRIKNLNPHHILIAGDNIQGNEWENSKSIRNLQVFLDNLRECCPVFIILGNHDLIGNNLNNYDIRISNFKKLEHENIYPLHEDKAIYDGFEIIGITPSFILTNNSFVYNKDLLHQMYIEEINKKVEIDTKYVVEFLGHDPNMLLGNNLGLLESSDFLYSGHMHNGYFPSKKVKRNPDKYLEYGIVEKCIEKDEYGNIKSIYPFIITKCDLARGVIYFDNNGNKKYLLLRNGNCYKYVDNKWLPCQKEEINDYKLKALIITGGIRKFSYFSNLIDIPEITEINYVGKGYRKEL